MPNLICKMWLWMAALVLVAVGSGCGQVEPSGFLRGYDDFKQASWLSPDQEYLRPGVDWKRYRRVRVLAVVDRTRNATSTDYREVSQQEVRQLIGRFENALTSKLGRQFQLTNSYGTDVLEVRAAVTRLRPTNGGANAAAWIIPYSFVVTGSYTAATNSSLTLGEAGVEIEVLDSLSRKRLYGLLGLHLGSSLEVEQVNRWGIAEKALDKWAESLTNRLAGLR